MNELENQELEFFPTEELKNLLNTADLKDSICYEIGNILLQRKKIYSQEYGEHFSQFLKAGIMNRID